jgi:hypothetical protein
MRTVPGGQAGFPLAREWRLDRRFLNIMSSRRDMRVSHRRIIMFKKIALIAVLINLAACSGLRTTDDAFSAHAENFNILFLQIPGGDTQKRAMALVPENSQIITVNSMPTDTTSLIGFISRLIGVDFTFINGTIKKDQAAKKDEAAKKE